VASAPQRGQHEAGKRVCGLNVAQAAFAATRKPRQRVLEAFLGTPWRHTGASAWLPAPLHFNGGAGGACRGSAGAGA